MTHIICCKDLSDALGALTACVSAREGKNIVFCEDRLTLLAERAVLSRRKASFQTEVTTFSRFLSGEKRVLSKQGSVMKLASLIEAHAGDLGCFKKGAAQAVYETIAQLSASRVDGAALRAGAEQTEGLLKLKLTDLALLLEEYTSFLQDSGYVDENGYLALLPSAVERAAKGAHVVFFAFPSFTKQALEGVRAALGTASEVTAVFVDGDAAFCTHEAKSAFVRAARDFGPFTESEPPSTLSRDAEILYHGLFSPEKFGGTGRETSSVFAFEGADEAAEMDTVCALIKKHLSEGMRYRDFAVLVPDAGRLFAVERAFAAYRIPYFADRKRPFSEHIFCAFALAVLRAVSDGGLPASVDAVAANVLFGEGGDEYRNYLLKFGGYRGAVRREIKEGEAVSRYRRENLVSCRGRMLSYLAVFPRKGTCAEYVAGVRALLSLTDAEGVVSRLRETFTGADRAFLDLSPLEGVLAEMSAVAGGETLTAREFSALFESGLSSLGISVLPQFADAVFVGDATESKFGRVKVLFATGLTEALPRTSRDTALISDRDIGALRDLRVEIEPAIAVVNARARESLAVNLCSFSEALYLSRPLRAGDGETQKSEIFSYAERLFRLLPPPDLFPFDCCEEEPAALALLKYRERYLCGEEDGSRYASLQAALLQEWGAEKVEKLLSEGKKEGVPEAAELYFSGEVSPTLLEKYCECPYAGFALRALRLREREERTVQDTDAGTFVHAVLERVAPSFNGFQSEAECRTAARAAAEELLKSPRFSALADTAAGLYTSKRLVEECGEVSAAAYLQVARSRFRVRETEEEISLPELSLKGRADRVDCSDEYVRVIDYKTGAIDDKAVSYYTGRKLQLQLYLLAAARGGKAAGAFYFPAAESFTAAEEPKYRMRGFFSKEDEVVSRMDEGRPEGEKSSLFEGGGRTEKGMAQADFEDFLEYARLLSLGAEGEMREGNITPSPYEGACAHCKLLGACGFRGEPRREGAVGCKEIVEIVRRQRGERK